MRYRFFWYNSLGAAFMILVSGHSQSPAEGFHRNAELELKAGALLRRSDEELSPTLLDAENVGHPHHRSNAKGHNRHAHIDAFGHMSVEEDSNDDQFKGMSDMARIEHDVNHTLALRIDASGASKGLPEMSDDLIEDEENETHTSMVKHVRQLHSLKTGEMLDAIKRVNMMEADQKPWSSNELIHSISVLNGHDARPFSNISRMPSLPHGADGEHEARKVLHELGMGHVNLSDPASLAEIAMSPGGGAGGAARVLAGFLFGAAWIVDEDYPFLCICDNMAVCVGCPLGTTCRMRRGAGNGAFRTAEAHWLIPLFVLISFVWPAHN